MESGAGDAARLVAGRGDRRTRAFFSHSSRDAELVRAVGREVGRPFVIIDYFAFQTGDELLTAVQEALEASALFVLFVSRSALASDWVKREVEDARHAYAFGRLKRVLIYITDTSIKSSDLPAWLRAVKYTYSRAAKPIAREIRSAIDEEIRERQNSFFVGRRRELDLIQEQLAPTDGSEPSSRLILTGLDGIGRQTLVSRAARDLLSVPRVIRVMLESGDSIHDVAVKVASLVEPISTPADAERVAAEIQAGTADEAFNRTTSNVERIGRLNEMLSFYDRGGLLDNDGRIVEHMRQLLARIENVADVFTALLTNRRPTEDDEPSSVVPRRVIDVRPLQRSDVLTLITLTARAANVTLTRDQRDRLADHVRGYPPAVAFAIELVRAYGAAAVLAERERIISFRTNPFVQYIRALGPDSLQTRILRTLSENSPLPLEILTDVVAQSEEEVGRALIGLIDASLVLPDDSQWYRIADPVSDAITREFGSISPQDFQRVASALGRFLSTSEEAGAYFELSRVRFRALVLSGDESAAHRVSALAADWIRLAQKLYHGREYEAAVRVARAAVETRRDNVDALTWLTRALIKTDRFSEAADAITEMRRLGLIRETLYYEGFLDRHRGQLKAAAEHYRAALNAGFRGIAIHRELALCYFGEGDFAAAERHIGIAQERQPDNRYLIDLRIQIACVQGDESTARQLLELLTQVDQPAFVAHRRSRVEDTFGDPEDAYLAAKEAVALLNRPPFEILAQLVLTELKTGRREAAASDLTRLDQLYPSQRADIRTGLRCRVELAYGRYESALGVWSRLKDQRKPVHLKLKRDALAGLLDHTFVPSAQREAYERELADLTARIESARAIDLILMI